MSADLNKSLVVMRFVSGVFGAGAVLVALASCPGSSTPEFGCAQYTLPEAEFAAVASDTLYGPCGEADSILVASCPTAGLVSADTCFYDGTLAAAQGTCESEGGNLVEHGALNWPGLTSAQVSSRRAA
jgi:hypothetical protein